MKLGKRKPLRRWKIALISIVALIGGVSCTTSNVNAFQSYFGETKSKKYYSPEKDEFVNVETVLYISDLGYITFYDKDYFKVIKEGNKEQFVAKTGKQDGLVEIELIQNQSYESLAHQLRNNDEAYDGVKEPNGIECVYYEENYETSMFKTIGLCDVEGVGVFKIAMEYKLDDFVAAAACWYIGNQFVYLDKTRIETIDKGKCALKFKYDNKKYELVRDTAMSDDIMLQKVGADLSELGDIVLSYRHYIDSAKKRVEMDQKNNEQTIVQMKEYVENLQDEQEKEEEEAILKEQLPLFEKMPNDLKVPAVKVKTGTSSYNTWDYYIDDGKGGCYCMFVIDIQAEGLQEILQSIELVDGNKEVMDITDREYNAVG